MKKAPALATGSLRGTEPHCNYAAGGTSRGVIPGRPFPFA